MYAQPADTMRLDLGTLLWVLTLVTTVMGVAVLIADPRVRRGEGLGAWGLGILVNAASYPVFALRYASWPEASIVVTNLLTTATVALHTLAVLQFGGRLTRSPRDGLIFLPVLVTGVVALVWVDAHRTRNALVAAVMLGQAVWLLRLALQPGGTLVRERGRLMLTIGSALLALLLVLRMGQVVFAREWPDGQAITADIQATTYLVTLAVLLLNTIGYLLMHMQRALEHERAAATRDALTGTLTRRPLMEAFEQGVSLAVRERQPYAVLMLDLDHFKRVNDEHGHPAGDAVLRQFAQRLSQRLRRSDLLGRYGGEEFLVLLPGTDLAGARTVAEGMRRAIADEPFTFGALRIPVTVSVGVRVLEPADPDAPGGADGVIVAGMADAAQVEPLIADADRALYAAKRNGRNRVEVAA